MGLLEKPNLKSYWSSNLDFNTPMFPNPIIIEEPYPRILRLVYFVDNINAPDPDDSNEIYCGKSGRFLMPCSPDSLQFVHRHRICLWMTLMKFPEQFKSVG